MTAWDGIFAREGRVFLEPHEDMPRIVKMFQDRGASTVLDLGSGTGRHVVYLAKSGFSVYGFDNSLEALAANRQWLAEEGLEAELRLGSMTERFPYEDGFFDAVVSVQVIHHADMATIRGIVDEISRVLKEGGLLLVTVPKLRNQGERFEQLEPNTFVPLDGPEKGLPHHYFTPEELQEVFGDYDIVDIHLDGWEHYCLSAFKKPVIRNPVSISIAPTMQVIGKRYYDLPGTIELMHHLWQEAVVDGFEFQNLAEWDAAGPPRDEANRRLAAWEDSQRHTTDELASLLRATGLPIRSIHANRDVGICLCSGDDQDVIRGRRLVRESLSLAEKVGAPVCVFHLWDTLKEAFDPAALRHILRETATHHLGVKAAVENVPTQIAGVTPFDLVQRFEWITLDLQWAAMYDELDRFEPVMDRVVNVHLRGCLEGRNWLLDGASFGFYEALRILRQEWGYCGLLTMEPNGLRDGDLERFVAAMASLKGNP